MKVRAGDVSLDGRRGGSIGSVLLSAALVATAAGCASGGGGEATTAVESAPPPAAGSGTAEAPVMDAQAAALAEQWGVEMVGARLTAADYMLDVRYKVLDPDKAGALFERTTKAILIHEPTGTRIKVHSPAKTGPLRPTNPPEAGRIYFTMFSNPQGMVKRGDVVTLEIGEFEASMGVE